MATIFKSYRKGSRTDWGANMEESEPLDREQLQLGALLRIADGMDYFSEQYQRMEERIKRLESGNEYLRTKNAKLEKQVAAYKGLARKKK